MKYQGFYDYALGDDGKPDRTFTAQQFCKHLSAIFGSGIVITNATGNDAWKVEKITNEDLKIKIKLGNNNFNFASLRGNPFAVDEEINIELSQGTDRWDAIMIRADATSTVRATDIKVTENSIALTRTDTIYDLRLARVHVVNDVITEIIDDRLNNDYCGIAAGLATINAEDILTQIQSQLEAIESGEAVVLKDSTLFKNIEALLYLNSIYNKPSSIEVSSSSNTLKFTQRLTEYKDGMTVKLDTTPTNSQVEPFSTRLFPIFGSGETEKDGYKLSAYKNSVYDINATSGAYRTFDNDESTACGGAAGTGALEIHISCPMYVNPSKIHLKTKGTSSSTEFILYGIDKAGQKTELFKRTASAVINEDVTIDTDKYFVEFGITVNNSVGCAEFSILEGKKTILSSEKTNYININNLGSKLLRGAALDIDKKYELVYDGNTFTAREVVFE